MFFRCAAGNVAVAGHAFAAHDAPVLKGLGGNNLSHGLITCESRKRQCPNKVANSMKPSLEHRRDTCTNSRDRAESVEVAPPGKWNRSQKRAVVVHADFAAGLWRDP